MFLLGEFEGRCHVRFSPLAPWLLSVDQILTGPQEFVFFAGGAGQLLIEASLRCGVAFNEIASVGE